MNKGILKNLTTSEEFQIKGLPEFMRNILNKGGLIPYLKEEIAKGKL